MKFFIHLPTDIKHFELLNEWFLLSTAQDREIADFFLKNFKWEIANEISPQYEINFMAIREIKRIIWKDSFNKISGIYYWSDSCEYLIWYKKEIIEAWEKFQEFNKKFPPHEIRTFVFVTPYVGDKMLPHLEESLDYLNNLNTKKQIEIVVNDYGVLNVILKKYTNLKPIAGRLLIKLLKTPLIDTFWYDVHPAWELIKNKKTQEIQELKDEIIKWQKEFYESVEFDLELYRDFLKSSNIDRATIEFMEHREWLYDNSKYSDIWVDLYYPWALVFTGRLCDTCAIKEPRRWMYAIDDICGRVCKNYDIFYKINTVWYKLIQRWNSAFRSEINLDYLPQDFIKNDNNRFVFSPFIPV